LEINYKVNIVDSQHYSSKKLLVYGLLIRKYSGAVVTFSITVDNLNITTIILVIIAIIIITIVLSLDVQQLQIWYAVTQIYFVNKLVI